MICTFRIYSISYVFLKQKIVFHTLSTGQIDFITYYVCHCRCALQIKQKSSTNATSSQRAQDGISYWFQCRALYFVHFCIGKWDNLFTAVMVFTNTGDSDLAITNLEGYYCTTGRRGMLVGVAVEHITDFHSRWIRWMDEVWWWLGWRGVISSV